MRLEALALRSAICRFLSGHSYIHRTVNIVIRLSIKCRTLPLDTYNRRSNSTLSFLLQTLKKPLFARFFRIFLGLVGLGELSRRFHHAISLSNGRFCSAATNNTHLALSTQHYPASCAFEQRETEQKPPLTFTLQ